MDVINRLQNAITMVEEARGVPLSASCVLHRGELVEILEGAKNAFPSDLEATLAGAAERPPFITEKPEAFFSPGIAQRNL